MAGRIPQSFVDDLIDRTDIVDIIDSRVPLKRAGKDYKACCPFHDEKTPSFTVVPDKQFYHCFGCGANGSVIGFLMQYDRMEFVETIEALAQKHGLDIPYETSSGSYTKAPKKESKDLYSWVEKASKFFRYQLRHHPAAPQVIEYLKKRGISGEIAKRFEIGFAPDQWDSLLKSLAKNNDDQQRLLQAGLTIQKDNGGFYDRFRDRVMFPIHDGRGRIVAFGGRIMEKGEPKYLNSPETPIFHKGSDLYGLYFAQKAIDEIQNVLVVEGYMDVIMLAQHDIHHAVATLGTATTHKQIERLFRVSETITFCYDGDEAGRRAAWKALDVVLGSIREARQVKFLFLPQGHDPDSLVQEVGKQAFLELVAKAKTLSEFLFEKFATDNSIDSRVRLAGQIMPFINKLGDPLIKDQFLQELSRYAGQDIVYRLKQGAQKAAPTSNYKQEAQYGGNRGAQQGGQSNNNIGKSRFGAENTSSSNRAGQHYSAQNNSSNSQQQILLNDRFASRAVQILLQQPKLYTYPENVDFSGLINDETVNLLIDVARVISFEMQKSDTLLTTGRLLERYRQHPYHSPLEKLASGTHMVEDDEKITLEFKQIIYALAHQSMDRQISAFIDQSERTGWNDDNHQVLKTMYQRRDEIKKKWLD